ncbi:MAG: VWA domain-containing protein [Phycisphaerales bacterium]
MKRTFSILGVGVLSAVFASNATGQAMFGAMHLDATRIAVTEERPVVDLALCLDTSGSMSGLIDAARMKLWEIVNDLALADPAPRLRVALLTFGNDGHSSESGWVRVDVEFTEDLDLVSERLFALTTNGGTELVGRVLDSAAHELEWNDAPTSLKLIVVAGNESANQDQQVSFRDASKRAIERDIIVNSIYCGDPADNLAPEWREVAVLADGRFASIDQNQGTIIIETPFDEQLVELSAALNETYLPFGDQGERGWANQTAQDRNAVGLNTQAAASRAVSKSSQLYVCSWDLVDACRTGQIKLEEVEENQLPEALRAMTVEERQAHLEGLSTRRESLQSRIQSVNLERETYIRDELARQAADPNRSFDFALRTAVREQAAANGLKFSGSTVNEAPVDSTTEVESPDVDLNDC